MKRTCRRRTFAQIRAEERHAIADMLERFAADIRPKPKQVPHEQLEIAADLSIEGASQ
jgi:hypothetical protein